MCVSKSHCITFNTAEENDLNLPVYLPDSVCNACFNLTCYYAPEDLPVLSLLLVYSNP